MQYTEKSTLMRRDDKGISKKKTTDLQVLQVSLSDIMGGEARIAQRLHQAYLKLGIASWRVAGHQHGKDSQICTIPNAASQNKYQQMLLQLSGQLRQSKVDLRYRILRSALVWLAEPQRQWDLKRGIEDFHYPASWQVLDLLPQRPDILHLHNLHGYYFDLRALPSLSRQIPTLITLHDAWMLSGHCTHSFDCERWRTGCGTCPDLTIYPAIRRDATAYNWRRKQQIYTQSRLFIATPSRWLMNKVEASMLMAGIVEAKVIHNGVDLTTFKPGDKQVARARLHLPQAAKILLFAANGIRQNPWKDYQTLREAIAGVADQLPSEKIVCLALGEDGPIERLGQAEIHFAPYQDDVALVAQYYQAADIYVHATRADTFPNTVLEALASGIPVVATAVGGIPEQVISLVATSKSTSSATGILFSPGDTASAIAGLRRLLSDDELTKRLGENARQDACNRFDSEHQINSYLAWYQQILERNRTQDAPGLP